MSPAATPAFFDRPVLEVAPDLLGAVLTATFDPGPVSVRLTEVEAYDGAEDPGSHAFRGRTPRNSTMFGPPGSVYVYFTYGMHYCANLVCGPPGVARAVLLRVGEIVDGDPIARARRFHARPPGVGKAPTPDRLLARGPANLAKALGLTGVANGLDVTAADSALRLVVSPGPIESVRTGPRVGVAGPGGDAIRYPWRFWLADEASVSSYRPAVKRVRRPRTP